MSSVFLEAQGITSELLLEEIYQARHAQVALAISQHDTSTALETVKRVGW